MLWKMLACVSKAVVYRSGLGFAVSSKGPDSSSIWALDISVWSGAEIMVGVLLVAGRRRMVGIAQVRRRMLSQKGSQRFVLMVKEASVGPMKETT